MKTTKIIKFEKQKEKRMKSKQSLRNFRDTLQVDQYIRYISQ